MDAEPTRRVIVLGSTGSIGRQAIDVIEHLNALHARGRWRTRYRVVGLAAQRSAEALLDQCRRLECDTAAVARPPDAGSAQGVRIIHGDDAPERLVRDVDADIVVAGVAGTAGAGAALAAVELGRDVALANKEALVAAGSLVVAAARRTGASLLPIDSEHSGLWQALRSLAGEFAPPCDAPPGVARYVLTASGGPFLDWPLARMRDATPDEALSHPTWRMGPKVTVDSACLVNKALEIIEARWLFGMPPGGIGAVIHPQSALHALVETIDGGMLAHLAAADMRAPIQYALTHPERAPGGSRTLDLASLGRLEFIEPDPERFPALDLARIVLERGGSAGAVFAAAAEECVRLFLDRARVPAMPFGRIVDVVAEVLEATPARPVRNIEDVRLASTEARDLARRLAG